jgi:NO-binding membrane sensor protein with MHYT domain/nitrogen-specific signal transduction histidine kinase
MSEFLNTGYDVQLVIGSICIAVLASYTAIELAGRVTATQRSVQLLWLLGGALAMGTGIWSMHFIGMLAFRLPVAVHYDFRLVFVSLLPAILASGWALFLVSRASLGALRLLGGSLVMGLGITSMHYIGMAAMQSTAMRHYDLRLVGVSVLVAIAVALVGLFLVFSLRAETTPHQIWKKLTVALIMGSAIPAMHYTGMAAADFMGSANMPPLTALQPPENSVALAAAVILGALFILGLALLTAFFDRRLSAQIIQAQAIQESQKYLKTILQGIQVGVIVLGEAAKVQLSNRAALDLLQISTETELQQLWDQALSQPTEAAVEATPSTTWPLLQPYLHNIVRQETVQNVVVDVKNSTTQEPMALMINAVPLHFSNAIGPSMVCTLNDVTELKQTENRLQQHAEVLQQMVAEMQSLQLQLVQSEKMSSLGQLVAGVAHEINNPVNFICGNLGYMREYIEDLLRMLHLYQKHYPQPVAEIATAAVSVDLEFLQDDLSKILNSMKIGTDRIRQIVLSLRNFSRMDQADFKSVNLHEGLDSTLMILQHRLKARSDRPEIKVLRNYTNLPLVDCFAGQLNQVFMNILTNAIDALEEAYMQRSDQERQLHPCQLTLCTAALDGGWVQVTIADNGTGIPEVVQQHIFDPFFTTKPVGKGTGMGLSISYQIVTEKHHGRLKCVSMANQGTEFVIEIPIRQQALTEV